MQPSQNLPKFGVVDETLAKYMRELQRCSSSSAEPMLPSADTSQVDEQFDTLQANASCQPPSTEQTQPSSADSPGHTRVPQGSQPQPHKGDRSPEPGSKSVGPWVVSNRKVQKRYRERQKAERESMEQQLQTLTAQLEGMRARNIKIEGHNCTLEKAVTFKDHEVAQLQQSNHVMDTSSLPSADAKPLQPVATSRVSTGPSVIQEYKQRVKGMVGLMLRLSHEGASPALEQELELAASSMVMLFMRTFIFNAHDAARLMKANLEHDHYQAASVANVQEDPKQLWQGVMDKLELHSDQQQQMVNLRQHFLQNLADCHESREAICMGLQQGTQRVQTAYSTIDTDAQAYVMSMLELHHESSQLRDNLRRQHRIWMDFYATIFRLWDARQICCAAVHSFPRFPDLLAISSCVAIMDGSSSANGLPCDKTFRTHKIEMKRSPRYTHRLLADSSSGGQH